MSPVEMFWGCPGGDWELLLHKGWCKGWKSTTAEEPLEGTRADVGLEGAGVGGCASCWR